MWQRLIDWLKVLAYRINYAEGRHYARVLLAEGWEPEDLRRLLREAFDSMPNEAYAAGFTDELYAPAD